VKNERIGATRKHMNSDLDLNPSHM